MRNPFNIVADLEAAIGEYTGAPYVVCVNSCTMALLLAVKWHLQPLHDSYGKTISIPKHTYVSVPMSIIHAGGWPVFRDENWVGNYQLSPLPIWDSARYFSSDMYLPNSMICVSFHTTKILGDTQGGAILLDDYEAYKWLKRMRFDGREELISPMEQSGQGAPIGIFSDRFTEIGYHCYMSPDVATRLLWKIHTLPKHNDPLPNDDYPDLSLMEIFK